MSRPTTNPYQVVGLRDRLNEIEAKVEDLYRRVQVVTAPPPSAPGPFSWGGGVIDDFVDVRTSPWVWPVFGRIYAVHYLWDVVPATAVTVKWYYDGSTTALWTDTLSASTSPEVKAQNQAYTGEALTAEVTEGDATGAGLSAFVFLA